MVASQARPISTEVNYTEDFHRTYTSTYEVITNSRTDGAITAIEAPGIPAYRSSYTWYAESDPWAFCLGITARIRNADETATLWTVTVTHSTVPAIRCGDTRIEDPLQEPPRLSGSFARFQRPAEKDRLGAPILNSVDEPFVPALERDDSRDTLSVEVNTEQIDLVMRATYRDAINDAPLWGLPAYCVKLSNWSWQIAYLGTCTPFVINRVDFEISYRRDHLGNIIGWREEVLDAGFRHVSDCNAADSQDQLLTNRDAHDNQMHQPRPLNGAGQLININCGDDPPEYIDVQLYDELDFAVILQQLRLTDPLTGPFA